MATQCSTAAPPAVFGEPCGQHRVRLERACQLLVEQLAVEDVLDALVAAGALSLAESERLLDAPGGRAGRARQLVYLVARKSGAAYDAFRHALRADHPHLVAALDRPVLLSEDEVDGRLKLGGLPEDEVDGQVELGVIEDAEEVLERALQLAAAEPLLMRKLPQLARLLRLPEAAVAEFRDGAGAGAGAQERLYTALQDWLASEDGPEDVARGRLLVQLRRQGLTRLAHQLEVPEEEDWLLAASRSPALAQRWSQVARSLGLAADQVAEFAGSGASLQARTYAVLRGWADQQQEASVARLCEALGALRLHRLRQQLLQL